MPPQSQEFSFAKLFYSEEWSSQKANYRKALREELFKKYQEKELLDLRVRPRLAETYLSLSHCPSLGAYLESSQEVGLDIEDLSRISARLLRRISQAKERELLGEDSCFLWTAKEAAFKVHQGRIPLMTSFVLTEVTNEKVINKKATKQNMHNGTEALSLLLSVPAVPNLHTEVLCFKEKGVAFALARKNVNKYEKR